MQSNPSQLALLHEIDIESEAETSHYLHQPQKSFQKQFRQAFLWLCRGIAPSFLFSVQTSDVYGETTYLSGMRGLAAFCVFLEHFSLPYQPAMITGFGRDNKNRHFLQLPIIRLFYSGTPMVSMFFVISGLSLSIKPVQLQQSQSSHGLAVVRSSLFRRPFRLFLPPFFATFLVMIAVRFHCYDTDFETGVDGFSIPSSYNAEGPKYQPTILLQVVDWLCFVLDRLLYPYTWDTNFSNASFYASQLWTIPVEYWSSLGLYLLIITIEHFRKSLRITTAISIMLYAMWIGRWDCGLFISGFTIAEIKSLEATTTPFKIRTLHANCFWVLLFVSGLYLASVPDIDADITPGYKWMLQVSPHEWFWHAIGAIQVVCAVSLSSFLQAPFLIPTIQYLGTISYSLYIVHIPILHMYGWLTVPFIRKYTGSDTELQKQLSFGLGFLLIFPTVIWTADVFWRVVDEPSTRFARYVEHTCSNS